MPVEISSRRRCGASVVKWGGLGGEGDPAAPNSRTKFSYRGVELVMRLLEGTMGPYPLGGKEGPGLRTVLVKGSFPNQESLGAESAFWNARHCRNGIVM